MGKLIWVIIIGLLIFAYFKYVPEETKEKINDDIKNIMSNSTSISEKKYLGKVTADCSNDLQCWNTYGNESVCENGGCYG